MFLVGLFYVVSGVLIHPSVFKLVFKDQYIFEKGTQINFEDYDEAVFPNLTVPLEKFKKAEVYGKVFIFYEIGGLNQLTLSAPTGDRGYDVKNFSNDTHGEPLILNKLRINAKTELFQNMFIDLIYVMLPSSHLCQQMKPQICDQTNLENYTKAIQTELVKLAESTDPIPKKFPKAGYLPCLLKEAQENKAATNNFYKSRVEQWNNIGMNRNLLKRTGSIELEFLNDKSCFPDEQITFFTHKINPNLNNSVDDIPGLDPLQQRTGSLPKGKSLNILLIKPSKLGGESKHTAILCITTGAICCFFGFGFFVMHCIGFDLRQLRPEGDISNPEVAQTAQETQRDGHGIRMSSV